jgi:hypothetical protein
MIPSFLAGSAELIPIAFSFVKTAPGAFPPGFQPQSGFGRGM